jgi:hypothetical protein
MAGLIVQGRADIASFLATLPPWAITVGLEIGLIREFYAEI